MFQGSEFALFFCKASTDLLASVYLTLDADLKIKAPFYLTAQQPTNEAMDEFRSTPLKRLLLRLLTHWVRRESGPDTGLLIERKVR